MRHTMRYLVSFAQMLIGMGIAIAVLWAVISANDSVNAYECSTDCEAPEVGLIDPISMEREPVEGDPGWDCATMGNKLCGPIEPGVPVWQTCERFGIDPSTSEGAAQCVQAYHAEQAQLRATLPFTGMSEGASIGVALFITGIMIVIGAAIKEQTM